MRSLILADGSFASRERAMLARLEVGLADEGVRVVRATPIPPAAESLDNPYLRWIRFPEPSTPLFASVCARALLEDLRTLKELSTQDSEPIDVVHVFGDNAWATGERLARRLDAALMYEVWSEPAMQRAVSIAKALKAQDEDARRRVCFLCPDEQTERRLGDLAPWSTRRLATWGAHAGDPPEHWPKRRGTLSVLLIGAGGDVPSCRAALDALARVRKAVPNLLIFIDAALVRTSNALWKHAGRLKLLDCASVIEDTESRRELSLHVDAMLVPEQLHEHRTILLDAMTHGVAVVARAGCPMSALRDGETAILLDDPDADAWERALGGMYLEQARTQELTRNAAEFVRQSRPASGHVRGAIAAYEAIAGADPVSFAAGARVR